jgi:hypothetical protein
MSRRASAAAARAKIQRTRVENRLISAARKRKAVQWGDRGNERERGVLTCEKEERERKPNLQR